MKRKEDEGSRLELRGGGGGGGGGGRREVHTRMKIQNTENDEEV